MKFLYALLGLFLLANTVAAQITIKEYKSLRSPSNSAVSAKGEHFYVSESKGISVFTIDPTTKKLDLLQNIPSEKGLGSVVLTPDNQFVLATGYSDNSIFLYQRAANGTLKLHQSYVGNIGRATLKNPHSLVISPSGRYLFVNCDQTLFTFRLQHGQLDYVAENVLTGSYHGRVYFSPDNKHVFISDYGSAQQCYNTILTLDEQTGQLTIVDCLDKNDRYFIPGTFFNALSGPKQHSVRAALEYMSFSPDGKDVYMYATESYDNGGRGAFMHYRLINGKFEFQKAYRELDIKYQLNTIKNMYLDGSGDYFYVLTGSSEAGVFIFKRNRSTGGMTFVKSFRKLDNLPRIGTPYRVSFTPDNKGVYISNYFGANVMVVENKDAQPSPFKRPVQQQDLPRPVVDHSSNHPPINSTTNSNTSTEDCQFPSFSKANFNDLEQALKQLSSDQDRYDLLLKEVQNNCLQTVQILRLARALEVEYLRLEFAKFAYYYTSDLENFDLLDSLFTSNRLQQAFYKYLEG